MVNVVWMYVLQEDEKGWKHIGGWGSDFEIDSFTIFCSLLKLALEIGEAPLGDLMDKHICTLDICTKGPTSYSRNPFPYNRGQKVKNAINCTR